MGTTQRAPVVVGVDGSAAARAAVRAAAREAAARDRPLRVVHSVVWPFHRTSTAGPGYPQLRQRADELLTRALAAAEAVAPGLPVTGLAVDQPPVVALLRESRTAGLLVLGAEDLSERIGLPVESVLVQVVARARCPVLVTGSAQRHDGPVVVGFDGSAAAGVAVAFAFDEAARRRSPLVAVQVTEPGTGTNPGTGTDPGADRRLLDRTLSAWQDRWPTVAVERHLLDGDPVDVLLERGSTAQLLVIGPRGAGAGPGTLLGTVGQTVLRLGRCPTVFVRPPLAGN